MIGPSWRLNRLRPSQKFGGAQPSQSWPPCAPVRGRGQFDLGRDARTAGRENLPSSNATSPTEIETEIARAFEQYHRESARPARVEIQRLTAQFTAVEASLPNDRDLADAVVGVAADVDREVGSAGELASLWAERERRLRDLRVFGREHGRTQDARYPASRWLHLGVVASLALIESWANSGFFSEATDFGLVGGFLGACGVALINVLTGFVAGWLVVPWLAYRSTVARLLALVGLSIFIVAGIVFNVAVAGYRDQLIAGTAAAASFHNLLHDPFHLRFLSTTLLGTGLLAWAIALWKGYTLDDGYPFYGALDRRFRDADRAFAAARDALVRRVVSRVQRLPSDIRVVFARGTATLARLDAIVVEANRVRDAYETEREDLHSRTTAYLKAWREENCFVRTDMAPAYFAEFPPFTALITEGLVRELAGRAKRARTAHRDLEARAHRIVLESEGRVATALARVQAYVTEVMRQAHRGESPAAPAGRTAA
jgi:hypothetical protein